MCVYDECVCMVIIYIPHLSLLSLTYVYYIQYFFILFIMVLPNCAIYLSKLMWAFYSGLVCKVAAPSPFSSLINCSKKIIGIVKILFMFWWVFVPILFSNHVDVHTYSDSSLPISGEHKISWTISWNFVRVSSTYPFHQYVIDSIWLNLKCFPDSLLQFIQLEIWREALWVEHSQLHSGEPCCPDSGWMDLVQ